MHEERDASNFDFRVVALLTALITRPDLLHEYLNDGKAKNKRGKPLAIADETKWPTLRRFGFPPELLGEMLGLFEKQEPEQDDHAAKSPVSDAYGNMTMQASSSGQKANDNHAPAAVAAPPMPGMEMAQALPDVQAALRTIQRLFRTMVAIEFYCPDDCPDDDWFEDFVPYAGKTSQPLKAAGVQRGV